MDANNLITIFMTISLTISCSSSLQSSIDSPLKMMISNKMSTTSSPTIPRFLLATSPSTSPSSASSSDVQPENVIESIDVSTTDETGNDGSEDGDQASRFEWGDVITKNLGTSADDAETSTNNLKDRTIIEWTIPLIKDLISSSVPMVLSPRFYVSNPGHRLQLILVPNSTYSDGTSYLGVFFRLVTGDFDADLEWPYQYRTEISIVASVKDGKIDKKSEGNEKNETENVNKSRKNLDQNNNNLNATFNIVPNRDPCRLRSAFLRPSTDTDNSPNPDGCGSRRLIPLNVLLSNENGKNSAENVENENQLFGDQVLIINGSITIRAIIYLKDVGKPFETASLSMKYNQLSAEYVWTIPSFPGIQNASLSSGAVAVLSSDPFYTHSNGYLIQMFLTLLPSKRAFAISTAMIQGDFDRNLDWPFPYNFEVAIIDQSPNYWRRDYTISLDSSSADCGSAPFGQPTNQMVDFCFITVQSMELLTLTHYNFIRNGSLKIRFMTKLTPVPIKQTADLSVHDNHLVAEYSWLVPDIESKLERFDYSGRKVKTFISDKFYTNHQGYLIQMVLFLNHTDKKNGSMGLELQLLEGKNDGKLFWPFKHKFELLIVNQRPEEAYTINNHHNVQSGSGPAPMGGPEGNSKLPPGENNGGPKSKDVSVMIDPQDGTTHSCDLRSFTKPIERNPSCGRKNLISFARVSRSTGFVRLGSLLVKTRIYLKPLII